MFFKQATTDKISLRRGAYRVQFFSWKPETSQFFFAFRKQQIKYQQRHKKISKYNVVVKNIDTVILYDALIRQILRIWSSFESRFINKAVRRCD
jgi:hypothetical protein